MEIVTSADRPDLDAQAAAAFREKWPEFIFHDDAVKPLLPKVAAYFARYDVLLLDEGRVAAGGWGVPFVWDGTYAGLPSGYDATLARAVEDHEAGRPPNALSFMAAAVAAAYDRQGLAAQVLAALAERARAAGLERVVAPLRPTHKHRAPLLPMAEYAALTDEDGLSIDPWIRTHQRLGATILGPAPESMRIEGSVAEWESWTGVRFETSGDHVVPDALSPVRIDLVADRGVYVEENLWVEHPLSRGRSCAPTAAPR